MIVSTRGGRRLDCCKRWLDRLHVCLSFDAEPIEEWDPRLVEFQRPSQHRESLRPGYREMRK